MSDNSIVGERANINQEESPRGDDSQNSAFSTAAGGDVKTNVEEQAKTNVPTDEKNVSSLLLAYRAVTRGPFDISTYICCCS